MIGMFKYIEDAKIMEDLFKIFECHLNNLMKKVIN